MQSLTNRLVSQINFRLLSPIARKKISQNIVLTKQSCLLSRRSINMSSNPTYTADYLTDKLKKSLDAEHVDIEDLSNCGCGMKFDAVLVSPKFEGQTVLKRQRLVNEILSEEMKHIHAFTMQTLTPTQWREKKAKSQS